MLFTYILRTNFISKIYSDTIALFTDADCKPNKKTQQKIKKWYCKYTNKCIQVPEGRLQKQRHNYYKLHFNLRVRSFLMMG